MPTFKALAWNIQNFGFSTYNTYGPSLIAFIAEVMVQNAVSVAAICEIRGAAGAFIGADLVAEMNNSALGGNWQSHDSPQYGTPRWEQYVFVWNTNVATNNQFIGTYPIPNTNPVDRYGFPTKTRHRPPYCGDFTIGAKRILISMYHAPNPSKLVPEIRNACDTIADLTELAQHDGGILMGDFNVPYDEDVTTANTNGAYAYRRLASAATGVYDEELINQDTSLISYANAGTVTSVAGAFSSPYDKFFVRRANNGVTLNAAAVDQIFPQAYNGGTYEASLQAIQTANNIAWVLVNGHYSLPQSFRLYRGWVSDHVPIVITVNY